MDHILAMDALGVNRISMVREIDTPYTDVRVNEENKMLTDEQITKLKNTKNEEEWNNVCGEVKAHNGGRYPADWFPRVVLSGLMKERATAWGDPRACGDYNSRNWVIPTA